MTLNSDPCQQQQPLMRPAQSFPQFKLLPPEIRHLIWRQALSEWAVWYTSHPHSNLQAHGLNLRMRPVGAAPYQVGLACQEARHVMELLYTKLPGFVGGAAAAAAAAAASGSLATYWLIPERTIVYLGCPGRATDFIEIMHAHQTLPLRHVVLQWSDIVDVIRFCHGLARSCPDLQTFILHATDRTAVCRCESPLSQSLADWYTTIASCHGQELPYQEHADAEVLLWSVGECFGDQDEEYEGPQLHFLPTELQETTVYTNERQI